MRFEEEMIVLIYLFGGAVNKDEQQGRTVQDIETTRMMIHIWLRAPACRGGTLLLLPHRTYTLLHYIICNVQTRNLLMTLWGWPPLELRAFLAGNLFEWGCTYEDFYWMISTSYVYSIFYKFIWLIYHYF